MLMKTLYSVKSKAWMIIMQDVVVKAKDMEDETVWAIFQLFAE